MAPKTTADLDLVDKAVKALIKYPNIATSDAMILAGFPEADTKKKHLWKLIVRRLPGKGKREFRKLATPAVESCNESNSGDCSTTKPDEVVGGSSVSSTTISPLTEPSLPSSKKQKRRRLNSQQKQDKRAEDLEKRVEYKIAHKTATLKFDEERNKKEGGLSVRQVAEKIKTKFNGVGPSASTIHHYVVNLGLVGVSPLKMGPEGSIPQLQYKALCTAVSSKLRINQLNAKGGNSIAKQIQWIMKTMNYTKTQATPLWKRVTRDTASMNTVAGKVKCAEDRRIQWTTYHNLDLWFDSWEKTLDELGFFHMDSNNERFIPEHLQRNILNFDETSLSLDGSTVTRGGRPPVEFEDDRLPRVGKPTSKTSQTTTMINGSNAWGEALPPHFQFMTSAQTDEGKQIRNECEIYMCKVRGKFGLDNEVLKPVSYGTNEKGGMDDIEFAKYLRNAIMPLYPNAAPEKGKWVILKCDSGPGRMNVELLAELRTAGFILFPGVPNTTHVTQETDQNYGPFKGQYARNLDRIVEERVDQDKTTSIPAWMVGLIVFGGTDPITNFTLDRAESAFQVGFSREACRAAWASVGAVPLTRGCLSNPQVRKSIGDGGDDDEFEQLLRMIQEANDLSTHTLTQAGFNGCALKGEIKATRRHEIITEENTEERRIALMNASSQSEKFSKVGGYHLTSDDLLISIEMSQRGKEKKRLTTEKTRRQRMMAIEEKAITIMNAKGDKPLTVKELDTLLSWHNIKKIGDMSKEQKLEKWMQIQTEGRSPPNYEKWTDEDENALKEASRTHIGIGDTAVGRLEERRMREFKQTVAKFTPEEWAEIEAARGISNITNTQEDNNVDGDEEYM